jgi:hypothetical protein
MNYFFYKEDEKESECTYEEDSNEEDSGQEDSNEEDSKSEYSDDNDNQYKSEELQCKNIDPVLAKLMGIIIEEQKITNWEPPKKSGLDNSEEIISSIYFKNKNIITNIDFFQVIKDDIRNYKTLTHNQIEYIKNTTNEEKFELIEIYNKLIHMNMHWYK